MSKIKSITCHKEINSRGEWTIETHVALSDGAVGVQAIPSGASKGENEAVYIPVDKAVDVVSTAIEDALKGEDPTKQELLDQVLIEMDGTPNKMHLGGNSILSVSLAMARAAAISKEIPLYKYLATLYGKPLKKLKFPTPVFNILNGGKHAHNGLSFQEFMVIPSSRLSFEHAVEMGVDIYKELQKDLEEKGLSTGVGDEGGFAPEGLTPTKALSLIKKAASKKYEPGENVFLGTDVAAGSFKKEDYYYIEEENLKLSGIELGSYYAKLLKAYPIIYLEDGFYERDYGSWQIFSEKWSDKLMIVADDLVVTNPKILKTAIDGKLANAVIVKPNQVGTLSETLSFIKMAQAASMSIIVSHRSGDNAEDTFIADLALAVRADFIKSGAPARGERVSKYNRLLEIYATEK